MKRLFVVLVVCGSSLWPLNAVAQETSEGDRSPRTAIALGFSDGPEVGVWRRVGNNREIGLDFEVQFTGLERNGLRAVRASATPGLKRYMADFGARMAPYLYFGVPISMLRAHQVLDSGTGEVEVEQTDFGIGAIAGLGLEVRPLPRVSLGGHVGLRGSYFWGGEERDGRETRNLDRGGAGTYSSGIRIQLYF